jgi:8-oxo-dGTP pyrophosphatase MutT (NUDIX family)
VPIPDFVADLRALVGHHPLWLPGVTAVVRRGEDVLCVRRADTGAWTPVTGIVDPGEEPAVCAARETLEEADVVVRVDRLAGVYVVPEVVYPNGDRSAYVDLTFACTWVSGEPFPADGECTDARWFPRDALPAMGARMADRVAAGLSDEVAARFTG